MISEDNIFLAMFPAILAILIEAINPLSEAFLERQAHEAITKHKLEPNVPDVLRIFASGATSMSGLAPTGMSVTTGALTLLHDLPPAKMFWGIYCTLIVMVVLMLFMAREVLKRNPYDMATNYVRIPFGFDLPITYSKLHSYYIYFMNALLIALCLSLYLWQSPSAPLLD